MPACGGCSRASLRHHRRTHRRVGALLDRRRIAEMTIGADRSIGIAPRLMFIEALTSVEPMTQPLKAVVPAPGRSAIDVGLMGLGVVALVGAVLYAGHYWGRQTSAGNTLSDGTTRQFLTLSIFGVSALGILALAIATILGATAEADRKENVRLVFAAIVPLLASWVGTVIAYYYSRENLAAATNSVTQLAKVGAQKLESIPVTQKMIPRGKIDTKPLAELEAAKLKDVLAFLHGKQRQRLPVFDARDCIKYMIHESFINRFLAQQVIAGKNADDLTFKELVSDAALSKAFEGGFALVQKSANLADAKQRLEAKTGVEDVFVTETGKLEEPVLGWLTDNLLSDEAKL
jgi:hypothetical protein